ncbi:hypothetical protein CEY16_13310 [Halalkalibacillus sediminis]|uniref:TraB/GumN family protein n=1 Tax=Halalkalibacillus sediminis TaxID=2018042 RepID=A0A2I0QR32_9BACI|nr:DUF5694 domain-containing protein [Halalkalibacillus sediminis]PKR76792.1 hypothetical protein CEY16_13310 [Halalkalibacillus sediminis]
MDNLNEKRAKVMLLGSFHFNKPGNDMIEETYDFDPFSEERQKEISEVVELLGRFRPTKIAVETNRGDQSYLDDTFKQYLNNQNHLPAHEGLQIGAPLAKKFDIETISAVDDKQRFVLTDEEGQQLGSDIEGIDPKGWNQFLEYNEQLNNGISNQTLKESLTYRNSPECLNFQDSFYYKIMMKVESNENYLGADWMTGWYGRNLRIFRNLQRITQSENERILVIFGTGHIPILKELINNSPEHEEVDVLDYLK